LGVEVAGGWVGELRGIVPKLWDGSAKPESGRIELAPVRCLTGDRAVVDSWVAWW
jgi:hypothetical protein